METILGIDLGTSSIGWALTEPEQKKILANGVHTFPAGIQKDTIGQGTKEISDNMTRREKRQGRRQYFRKKLRKIKLLEILIAYNMCPLPAEVLRQWKNWDKYRKSDGRRFPDTPSFREWLGQNPYELRKRALSEALTRPELGRIFYHLIQRRGFLSNRKGKEDGKIFNGKDRIAGIDETRKKLGNRTLGEYLYEIVPKKGEKYVYRPERARARYTLRDMYIREFETIWNRQAFRLGLDREQVEQKRQFLLKGAPTGNRNRKHIARLQEKYGPEQVQIDERRITVTRIVSLKELLSGKIETDGEDLKFKSNESILFWQRPLRSQKSSLAKCVFEGRRFYDYQRKKWITSGPSPVPVSHPEFEEFRAYQFINNITYGKGEHLNPFQREALFELMCSESKDFNFDKIPKYLKVFEKFNYDDDAKVPVCSTISQLRPLFPQDIWESAREAIWHCFYFYDDDRMLFDKLKKDYRLTAGSIEKIKKIRLAEGYGSVSLKAVRRINPYLRKGYGYSTAVVLGGIRNAFGPRFDYFRWAEDEIEKAVCRILKEKNAEGEAMRKIRNYLATNSYGFATDDRAFEKLYHHSQPVTEKPQQNELLPPENLRNPIVQQALNELKRLINELWKNCRTVYGPSFRFDHIHVEMGRELRSSKAEREKQTRTNRENEKKNEEARQTLREFGLQPSRDNIQKYLLYKEIKEKAGIVCCPYTGKTLNIHDTLGGDGTIQIEHIIPYSISLDDSFANKTLCDAGFNREKGELTPYGFYRKNPSKNRWGVDSWEGVEERAFRLLPYAKAKRFVSQKEFVSDSFIARQLNDTRYISRKAAEYLRTVCNDVKMFPGQLTAELRHLWGLNAVLQSTPQFKLSQLPGEAGKRTACYVLLDERQNVTRVIPKTNEYPNKAADELLLAGKVEHRLFKTKNLPEFPTPLPDGRYWIRLTLSAPLSWHPFFAPKPVSADDRLTLKGKIREGVFTCDQLKQKIAADLPDGSYWISFPVENRTFRANGPGSGKKSNSRQVQLFGTLKEGVFRCGAYRCQTTGADGKYWCTLEVNTEHPEFTQVKNDCPLPAENQIVLTGTVNKDGSFCADEDLHYQQPAFLSPGKYYGVFTITARNEDLIAIDSPVPVPRKGETLVEGTVCTDERTGEIYFDPKKNREDQRHHAIDALVIAFSSFSIFQHLSAYNQQRKNKKRGIAAAGAFALPWEGFVEDVRKSVKNILVSYKQNTRTLCRTSKQIVKDGRTISSNGNAVRGQLHKETVYGLHLAPGSTEKAYHIRKDIRELKTVKQIKKVVDTTIQNLLFNHLQENYRIGRTQDAHVPADAFFKDGAYRIFLPNRRGEPVPVKKVRIKEELGNAVQLKSDVNQHVDPRNNHHVLLYIDRNGEMKEKVVTFWEAVERRNRQQPVYHLPEDGTTVICTLQTNDMFIIGLTPEELETCRRDRCRISRHLYRVQKISSMYYTFRHHLASTVTNEQEEVRIVSFSAWQRMNPVKIHIDILGNPTFY